MPYQPRVDLDRPVRDRLVLRSVPGAVDYLVEDLRALGPETARLTGRDPDAVHIEYHGPLRPLAAIRYFSTCAVELDDRPDERLAQSRAEGVLTAVVPDEVIRFRVGDLGDDRWALRDRLERGYGWRNSPTAWDINVERGAAEVGALYLSQRHGELLRTPASTNPLVAAVMVRLAKIEPGQLVLDPCCGAGTLLVLAGRMARPGRLLGVDVQRRWLAMAAANLGAPVPGGSPGPGPVRADDGAPPALALVRADDGPPPALGLVRADAGRLPVATGAADRVVANLPFGKRVGSHRVNTALYPAMLGEIARVIPNRGRAVLLTDDKRLFRESVQRTPLLRVIKEIVLTKGGLHPSVYVVTKRGSNRRHVS